MKTTDVTLQKLAQMKFEKLKRSLEGFLPSPIDLDKIINDNGETNYLIQISDETISLTTITCDVKGWSIHWGNSTPTHIKMIIEKVMKS